MNVHVDAETFRTEIADILHRHGCPPNGAGVIADYLMGQLEALRVQMVKDLAARGESAPDPEVG